MAIKVSVELSDKVRKMVELFSPESRKKMYFLMGQALNKEVGLQFDSQGAHFLGQRWQPLSEMRIKQRQDKNPNRAITILFDTGALKSRREVIATPDEGGVHLLQQYASTHEEGGLVSSGFGSFAVPQRKILPNERQSTVIVTKVVNEYIELETKGMG